MCCEEKVREVDLPTEAGRVGVGEQVVGEVVEEADEVQEDKVDGKAVRRFDFVDLPPLEVEGKRPHEGRGVSKDI